MNKKRIWLGVIILLVAVVVVPIIIGAVFPKPDALLVVGSSDPTATPTQSILVVKATTPVPMPTPTSVPTSVPPTPTPMPTRQVANPVCNTQTTNTPCVLYASIQDAAAGESPVGAEVSTSMNEGIVKVKDDLTYAGSSETTLERVQVLCYNIQQALWYMKSTINASGSQTIIKSAFIEVDITVINQNTVFASCRLTSSIVDKIDRRRK